MINKENTTKDTYTVKLSELLNYVSIHFAWKEEIKSLKYVGNNLWHLLYSLHKLLDTQRSFLHCLSVHLSFCQPAYPSDTCIFEYSFFNVL